MNPDDMPVGSVLVTTGVLWLVLLGLGTRLKLPLRQQWLKVIGGLVAGFLLWLPLGGLPVWNRAFSFYPNPSLPVLGLIVAALGQRLFGVELLKPADWRAVWIFGAIAGSGLYVYPVLGGGFDLYYWGWEREGAVGGLAALTVGLLAFGNRLGVLLLVGLLGFVLHALESRNCWDYVMDPFYWVASMAVLGNRAGRWVFGRLRSAPALRQGEPDQAVALPAPAESPAVAATAERV